MSLITTIADGAISLLQRFASKSTVLATVGGVSVTAGGLEASAATLGAFFTGLEADLKAKNYVAATEISLEEAVIIGGDVGVPYAGLAAQALPFAFGLINSGLLPYLATLVPDGQGGYVTKAWAADPRLELNPDGSFKIP